MKRGFTVVEILITLIIIGILVGLGTVGLRSTLVNGRDAERKADVETIARGLESYYNKGNQYVIGSTTKGTYPGGGDMAHMNGHNMCDGSGNNSYYVTGKCNIPGGWVTEGLPGTTKSSITPPGSGLVADIPTQWYCDDSCLNGYVATGYYVYRPYNAANSADPTGNCFWNCTRYEIWYREEATGQTIKVKSKHQ